MEEVSYRRGKWREAVFAGIVLILVAADQLTKWWVSSKPFEVIWDAGFLQIIHIQNSGVAFGMFQGHSLIFIILDFIGIIIILLVVFFFRRRWSFLDSNWIRVSAALILTGTIGNLIDRLFHHGNVTDFIDFKVWPVFNVADSCVTVGTIVLAVYLIFIFGRAEKSK
jgi:signal peptidase II